MIQLTSRDKDWIGRAIDLEMTRLQVKKKLQESKFSDERIEVYLNYYDVLMDKKRDIELKEEEVKKPEKKEEEREFKESVKSYFGQSKKELSWSERRQIKRFIKQVEKYSKMIKIAIKGWYDEMEFINRQEWSKGKVDKEMEYLKKEVIDRLIESKSILDIEDPVTHKEITKESLMNIDIDKLISLLEENVESLDMVVNGKITE